MSRSDRHSRKDESPVCDPRYVDVQSLGGGSYGRTYQAIDAQTGERVVLKKLYGLDVEASRREELVRREFDVLARLRHDHIVRVRDKNLKKPQFNWDLSFDFVPGLRLDEWFDGEGKSIPLDVIRVIGEQVASALAAIEDAELVHRDLSFTNLIYQPGKGVTLIDFGCARQILSEGTAPGTAVGTILPPEVRKSNNWHASADVYALGAMLGMLAAGTRDPADLFDRDMLGPPKRMRSLRADLPEAVAAVIERALAPDPKDRFPKPHARSFLQEWTKAFAHQAAGEPRENPHVTSLRRNFRRNSHGYSGGVWRDKHYVPTALDRDLLPVILRGELELAVLAGNPGDGKTAFLETVRDALIHAGGTVVVETNGGWDVDLSGRRYRCNYDASKAERDAGADERFRKTLEGLAGAEAPGADTGVTRLVAVNLGRLQDVVIGSTDANGCVPYAWLAGQLARRLNLPLPRRIALPQEDDPRVRAINLNQRCLTSGEYGKTTDSSFDRFLTEAVLARERWEPCGGCIAREACPARSNFELLTNEALGDRARSALKMVLQAVHLQGGFHTTFRDLRSYLASVVVGTLPCAEVTHLVEHGELSPGIVMRESLFTRAFNVAREDDEMLSQVEPFDPAGRAAPRLDRALFFGTVGSDTVRTGLWPELPVVGRFLDAVKRIPDPQERANHLRRLHFFVGCGNAVDAPRSSHLDLLPYRSAARFARALQGSEDLEVLRDEICRALTRAQGIPPLAEDRPCLLVATGADDELRTYIYKRLNAGDFAVEVERPAAAMGVEQFPNRLLFRHAKEPVSLRVGLDLFEWLMELGDGLVPLLDETASLFGNLRQFVRELQRLSSEHVHLLVDGGPHTARVASGGLVVQKGW